MEWLPSHCGLSLPTDEVHVWLVQWRQQSKGTRFSAWSLSEDEQQRAARFRFPDDRIRFTTARVVLRTLLAGYAHLPSPATVQFGYSPTGKPHIQSPPQNPGTRLMFNVSHAADLVMLAFCWNHEVGVDVEEHRDSVLAEKLAERFFSTDEQAALRGIPEAEQLDAFFGCWTRKEAYLKATGEGLSRGLDTFSVEVGRFQSAGLRSDTLHPEAVAEWRILNLPAPIGYSGALACHDRNLQARLLTLVDPA